MTINATRCTANYSSGWINAWTTVTWTANTNCAFNSDGTKTTDTGILNSAGTFSRSADYVNATSFTGTHCSTTASTG